jgi:hypothetical protein
MTAIDNPQPANQHTMSWGRSHSRMSVVLGLGRFLEFRGLFKV